ncbi:MAG: homoserine kinase [Methylococcales bacterium]|nr:homoserine kinase [Methylococcales bacterium]
MSVYTEVSLQELEAFTTLYAIGKIIDFEGVQAGIENTNYRVSSTTGLYILTIFESIGVCELPAYLHFLQHLDQNNYPAPKPQVSKNSALFHTLKGKPAAFFNCISGASIESPSNLQCQEIGEYLAKLHTYTKGYDFQVKNLNDLAGCQRMIKNIKPYLEKNDLELLLSEIDFQLKFSSLDLPKGIIHADLFRDNVLFDRGQVSGVLDFYTACVDNYLIDITITCNDWCCSNKGVDLKKVNALLLGYEKIRPLTPEERLYLPVFLRFSALRFWVSRLEHSMSQKESHLTTLKDPTVFRSLLQLHRNNHYDFSRVSHC